MITTNARQHFAQAGAWNVQLFLPEFAPHSVFRTEVCLGRNAPCEPGFWHRPDVVLASSPPGTH